jgi:hypothetical protein
MTDLLLSYLDHHPTIRAAFVIVAYLDLSLRLRFLETIIRRRKILTVSLLGKELTFRERWFRITTLLAWFKHRRRIVEDNGHGSITEENVDEVIRAMRERRKR